MRQNPQRQAQLADPSSLTMSKRRGRRPRGSEQPKTKTKTKTTTTQQEVHFSPFEEEFFRTGEVLHETTTLPHEEPEKPSLWRRLFARTTLRA